MLIFKKVADLQEWLQRKRAEGRAIGFAPTMGALHQGHIELVRLSKRAGEIAVASIFVNPTQFNDPKDLEKYPRTPERDIRLLLSADCDALFMPPVQEVYPPGRDLTIHLDFRQLERVMEGVFRPGHFAGMATVVHRLLDIVRPQRLYMGQKDFQQLSIVRDMLRQLRSPIELVMCPTVREADGLAMSSRNTRLTPDMRAAAPVIYQTLAWARAELPRRAAADIQAEAMRRLAAAGLRPEYFDIVDGISLLPVAHWADSSFVVACTAAFAGEVRLIDNLVLREGD
ncbi:MAG TPA: pantoate--beta-alanine ligase [Saprospiraceae bacterium]|nr:pantoate--beta-alanine ligase [Saprospiraceae bacterium]